MKRIITIILVIFSLTAGASAQFWKSGSKNDIIMMRDGTSIEAKIQQLSKNTVKFKNETSGVKADELPISDIYMIKYAKRGTVFFTREGNRKTGNTTQSDPKATKILTTDYREIDAWNVEFDIDKITYALQKPDKKNPEPVRHTLGQFQVFMILYPDGSSEIVTELDAPLPAGEQEQTQAAEPQEEQLKVVFHSVRQGDTLDSLAERYEVTPAQIIEWNELPATTKPAARLKPGQQLMLYVKNQN